MRKRLCFPDPGKICAVISLPLLIRDPVPDTLRLITFQSVLVKVRSNVSGDGVARSIGTEATCPHDLKQWISGNVAPANTLERFPVFLSR